MIEFNHIPSSDVAADNLVRKMVEAGMNVEDAQRVVDAASGIVLATLRGLDAKIKAASSDPNDQTLIQQLVLHQICESSTRVLEINTVREFLRMMKS